MKTRCAMLSLLVLGSVRGEDLAPSSPSTAGSSVPALSPSSANAGRSVPPQAITKVAPDYPDDLRAAKIQGTVIVEFTVETDGSVQHVSTVVTPHLELIPLAQAAVKQWTFTPGLKNGVPIAVTMRVPVTFALNSWTGKDPDDASTAALLASGNDAINAHDYDRAIDLLTRAIKAAPANAAARRLRGIAYADKKQSDLALADFNEAIQLSPTQAASYLVRAQFFVSQQAFMQALPDFDAAVHLAPKNVKMLEGRARAYFALRQSGKALEDMNHAIQLDPQSASSYDVRGSIYAFQQRDAEAVDDFEMAERLDPKLAAVRFNRSVLLEKRGDYAGARDDLEAGLLLKPNEARANNSLAWLLAVCPDPKVRDGANAVRYATKAGTLDSWKNPATLDTLAAAYAESGQFDLAVEWERKCINLHSSDVSGDQQRLALYLLKKPYREIAPDAATIHWRDLRDRTFLMVWKTVNESYYDPKFGGVDWAALQDTYRLRLNDTKDNEHLRQLLGAMLGELQRTHFAILPRESAVFNPAERVRIGAAGAECAWIDDQPVITEIDPDSPAAQTGLRPGDAVLKVNGMDLAPGIAALAKAGVSPARTALFVTGFVESRLSAAAGTKVQMEVSGPDGATREIALTCGPRAGLWSDPIGNYPSMPIHFEARHEPEGVAYLRFGVFSPQVMKDIRAFLRSLRPDEGLIIDLRGNPGGVSVMASGIAGFISKDEFSMGTMHLREGQMVFEVYPQEHAFTGPVAVLIDGRSASTSEIFAAGLQESHRARVFGEHSAGAALPSSFKTLPTGDLFQYAIADIKTPQGALLEGQGVTPDVVILRSRAELAARVDSVVAAASAWLAQVRNSGNAPPPVAAQ
jgi:carboxyl-terminal processing protease